MKKDDRKILLWLDTILCDAESDDAVVERYYQRFIHTMKTIGTQELPDNVDVNFIIHLSSDKLEYLPRITTELSKMDPSIARGARVHMYEHPAQGYNLPANPHIDQIKNPNKQPRRREHLFKDASAGTDFAQYKAVIRLSMDDDDLYFPGHLMQVFEASSVLLDNRPNEVSAAGFYRSYLVHVNPSEVTVDDVNFNKIIPGNKFYVVPENEYDRLDSCSPWALPESIDTEAVERFAAGSVHLSLIRNNTPTFAYMRRAQNLSGQSKAGYTDMVHSRNLYPDEQTFLSQLPAAPLPKPLVQLVDEPLPRIFRLTCRRSSTFPNEIHVSTNFSRVFDSECRIAFYLMRGQERLDVRWYSNNDSVVFESTYSNVTIRAFVKKAGKIIHRAASSRILS